MKYLIHFIFIILFIFVALYLIADFLLGSHSYPDQSWSSMPSELVLTKKDGRKIAPIRWKYQKNWDGVIYIGLYPLEPFEDIVAEVKTDNEGLSYDAIAPAEDMSGEERKIYIQSFLGGFDLFMPNWFYEQSYDGYFSYSGSNIIFPPGVPFMEFFVSHKDRVISVFFMAD